MHQQLRIHSDGYDRPFTAEDRRRYDLRSPKLVVIVWGGLFIALTLLLGLLFLLAGPSIWLWLLAAGISAAICIPMMIFMIIPDKQYMRRRRFAADNGFSYSLSTGGTGMQGVLFESGTSRSTRHVFSLPGGVIVADFTFEPSSSEKTQTWSYIELPLPRVVPHLVLDATSNDRVFGSSLPQTLARSQRITLEGDFDRHFTVYAPDGYDFDVRYLLPPDTMALLVDNLTRFDIEFFDDRLRIVQKGGWRHDDPRTWQFVEWVVNVLWPHCRDRTDRYRDARGQQLRPTPRAAPAAPTGPETVEQRKERFLRQWEAGVPYSESAHHAPASQGNVADSGRKLRRASWKTLVSAVGSVLLIIACVVIWYFGR